jgi:hypothetical protein
MTSNLIDHLPPDLWDATRWPEFSSWIQTQKLPYHWKKRYLFEWHRRLRLRVPANRVVEVGAHPF